MVPALFLGPCPSLVRLHEMRLGCESRSGVHLVDGRVRPHRGAGRGRGRAGHPWGPGWLGSTTCPLCRRLRHRDLLRRHQPTVHTWEGRRFILITWDIHGPPTDETVLPESLKVTVGNTS